jgi:hypothetical protein
MFKNLARGLLAAMPAAVAATKPASPFQRLDLATVRRVRCSHARVTP